MGQPSTDQHWRVWLGIGLSVSAIGVAIIVATLIFDPLHGDSWYSALTHLDWTLLTLGGMCALLGSAALSEARMGYRRERQRARAIAGDETAMELARVKLHGVAPADIEREDLALLWLQERTTWFIVGFGLFLALLVIAMFTAISVALVESAAVVEGATPQIPWNVIAGGAVAGALVIAWGVWRRARRLTKATGVVATGEGLRAIRAGKERAFIPWGEARLLEAWSAKNEAGFALSSGRALVEWRDYPMGEGPAGADGVSGEEMYLRAQTLLRTVIARTGLEPRACEPSLSFEERLEQAGGRGAVRWWNMLVGSAFLVGLVALPLITAASALLVPLTRSLAVRVYIAVTMGGLGALILAALLWPLIRRLRRADAPPVERPEVHLPPPPQIVATPLRMRVLRVWRDDLILSGILLLIAGDVYALVRVFTDTILPLNFRPQWWDPRMVSVTTLGLYSLFGGTIVVMALFSRTPRATVDDTGLRLAHGATRALIPWEMVAELEITVEQRGSVMYKAIAGDSQRTSLTWPAKVGLEGVTPAPGESPGALFAAVVAQRAGVTPTVVYK